MKVLSSKKRVFHGEQIPIYEMGMKDPVGFVEGYGRVEIVEEWRCGYCNSLLEEGKTHCPKCGGEY